MARYLICTGVPIARTGEYEYFASEGMSPGIKPDASGRIISRREPADVFAPAALASFEGKPVTPRRDRGRAETDIRRIIEAPQLVTE